MTDERPAALRWTIRGEGLVYDDPWVRLVLVDVQPPSGERFEHHVVGLGRIAVALVVDDQERVLSLYRYRFATNDWGYELRRRDCGAGRGTGCHRRAREVEEKSSGWRPRGKPEHLVSSQPLPGMVDAPIEVFLWRGADRVGQPTDTEEAARIEWRPVREMIALARQGRLLGSGTIVRFSYTP
jgi:hypothetical protein